MAQVVHWNGNFFELYPNLIGQQNQPRRDVGLNVSCFQPNQ